MKHAPTLMDEIYRMSLRNKPTQGWQSNDRIRHALEHSKRFVIDDSMSEFMALLSNEAFLKVGDSPKSHRMADSLRVQARLPHPSIWIEYNLRAYQKRAAEIRNVPPLKPSESPWREGWLIQQHPGIDTAHIMHMFTQDSPEDPARDDGYSMWTFPFAFGWCADDTPLPWQSTVKTTSGGPFSSTLVGIGSYDRDNIACVRSRLINDIDAKTMNPNLEKAYGNLLQEWAGIIRRVWALLATIDDLPMTVGEVRQSKGFMGRGRIFKYLSHQTIKLNVPAKIDQRVLARQMIAQAHHKRHNVRAHWRDDWRNRPSKRCEHLWAATDDTADIIKCSQCGGRQFFIHKHERGDASLGWVSHDYTVTHPKEGVQ